MLQEKLDRGAVLESIRRDYEVDNYFVSGIGEMFGYDPDCEFSDPFVSFKGVDRFKQNVSNLGAYLCVSLTHLHELRIVFFRAADGSIRMERH